MYKFFAVIKKEFLLIVRDIAGMVILFVMPVFLVTVVTLAQEDTLATIQESKINVLFADRDGGKVGSFIEEGLKQSEFFTLTKELEGQALTEDIIKNAVAGGDYQIGIIIPAGATKNAKSRAGELSKKSMAGTKEMEKYLKEAGELNDIIIYFDPAIRDSYRNSVVSAMQRLVEGAEIRILADTFFVFLRAEMKRKVDEKARQYKRKDIAMDIPEIIFPWRPGSLVKMQETLARKKETGIVPTMTQNNVPAFALFAMFFIVIPFSGSLIIERSGGTQSRIKTLPVSTVTLMGGKITVYLVVCLIQLAMMIAVGTTLLPIIGLPALEVGSNYGAIALTAIASALAAIGFGMAVGSLAGSIAQASMFGSVMVVVMAVLGGLMIPVYLMPHALGMIGEMISPIRWGIESFLEIFVRGGGVAEIMPGIIKLFLFFITTFIVSLLASRRRQ